MAGALSSHEMEVWLDLRGAVEGASTIDPERLEVVDAVLVDGARDRTPASSAASATRYLTKTEPSDGTQPPQLFRPGDETPAGALVDVSTPSGQDAALGLIGSVEWLVLAGREDREDREDGWLMIPAENLLASCHGTGTKIAAVVDRAGDVGGLAGALELGIDALCVDAVRAADNAALWDALIEAKEERRAAAAAAKASDALGGGAECSGSATIVQGTCQRLAPSGGKSTVLADRVCIDLVQSLSSTEGCWLGSSAKIMALVLSEAARSSFVPSRPFRVNAGPVHSYVVMGDGASTKYLAELRAGDEVAVYDVASGRARPVAVGRLKVEVRPCVQVGLAAPSRPSSSSSTEERTRRGQVFLQQAETVRLGQTLGEDAFLRITDLEYGEQAEASDVVLRVVGLGTHVGKAYSGKVTER